ncbi:hypothetical protein SAMN04488031_10299 [Roseovarius indicus]|nr:hypothetical protein SAMN04488031_10299 [Roseovarius indicus]
MFAYLRNDRLAVLEFEEHIRLVAELLGFVSVTKSMSQILTLRLKMKC